MGGGIDAGTGHRAGTGGHPRTGDPSGTGGHRPRGGAGAFDRAGECDRAGEPDPAGAPVVVLGIGNLLLGDDGLGVHVVRELLRTGRVPGGIEVIDGGTGGLSLLPIVTAAAALAIVDAVDVGAGPGTVHVLSGAALYPDGGQMSVHQVGVADLLAAARLTGRLPTRVVLVGVQPASTDLGVGLSPVVAAAVPEVIATVLQWCTATPATTGVAGVSPRACVPPDGRPG